MCQGGDLAVQTGADAHQNLRAQNVKQTLEEVEPHRQQRDGQQGRNARARKGAVVDLQHVEGAGQRQDVDDTRYEEQKDCDGAKSFCQLLRASLGRRLLVSLTHDTPPQAPKAKPAAPERYRTSACQSSKSLVVRLCDPLIENLKSGWLPPEVLPSTTV